jgi:16S rRNA (guanine527-N7)-methyltransferase
VTDGLAARIARLEPDAERPEALARFLSLLLEANERMNLVSARASAPDELVGRHLHDALLGVTLLPVPRPGVRPRLLDIGSGGGFPAIPLLISRPDVDGVLVEATRKKAEFLSRVVSELRLTATVVNARFPEAFPMTQPFEILTSRAVADGGALVRKARRFLRRDARALLWTTERLVAALRRDSGMHSCSFHEEPGAEARGIAVLEGFT